MIICIQILKVQIDRTFIRIYINLDTWNQVFQELPAAFVLSRSRLKCLYLYPLLRFDSYSFWSTPQDPDGPSLNETNVYVDLVWKSNYHFSNAIQKNIFDCFHQSINPTSTFYKNHQAKKYKCFVFRRILLPRVSLTCSHHWVITLIKLIFRHSYRLQFFPQGLNCLLFT